METDLKGTYVLAVDLGSSSGRGIVGCYEPGEGLTLEEVHRFESGAIPGSSPMAWDANSLTNEIREAVRKAVERLPVSSFGIDTWGVDYGLIDADGRLLADPVHYRDALEDIELTTGKSFKCVRIIGGGAQNGFICQQVADVLGMPVVAGSFEATAVGNVLVQLKALGAFASLDEACETVQPSLSFTTYRPSGEVPQDVINLYRHIRKRG